MYVTYVSTYPFNVPVQESCMSLTFQRTLSTYPFKSRVCHLRFNVPFPVESASSLYDLCPSFNSLATVQDLIQYVSEFNFKFGLGVCVWVLVWVWARVEGLERSVQG